jgi:foldase protein PrsA
MRVNKLGILSLLLAFVLVVAACGKDKAPEEEVGLVDGETEQNGQTEEPAEFPELDRTDLGADTIVATFEGGEVNGEEFATYIAVQGFLQPSYPVNEAEFRQEAVKFYIAERILAANIKEEDKVSAQESLDRMWEQLVARYDEEKRQRGYDALGITEENVKQFLLNYFMTESQFKRQITDEEITNTYNELATELTTASVRHILVATEERKPDGTSKELRTLEEAKKIADDLYAQLHSGADMATLATEHTDDPGSKELGGLYENVSVAQWVPEFKQAALDQEIGVIGEPVKTDFGYHIIRVEDRQVTPLEEIREPLMGRITSEKFMAYFQDELPEKIIEIKL